MLEKAARHFRMMKIIKRSIPVECLEQALRAKVRVTAFCGRVQSSMPLDSPRYFFVYCLCLLI